MEAVIASGTKGRSTREAILKVAALHFRERGFDSTTLEGIGETLGITRAAVLYHFRSKQELFAEVVDPYLECVSHLSEEFAGGHDAPPARRRLFLNELTDAAIAHPYAAGILYRQPVHSHPPDVSSRVTVNLSRYCEIIGGPDRSTRTDTLTSAVLSSILRPLTASSRDPSDPEVKEAVLAAAFAILALVDRSRGLTGGDPER